MKKIGILSFHMNYNFGASLQAYALQNAIQKFEPDCEIIDYQSDFVRNNCDPFGVRPPSPKEIVKKVTRWPYREELLLRNQRFADFTNGKLAVGPRCRTRDEVEAQAAHYECVVCGSDQGWNLDDMTYYLNFPKKQRRVTYATSFGKAIRKIPEYEHDVLPWVKTFDMLSMREISGVEYLRKKGLDCKLVLDPTLLLTIDEYGCVCEESSVREPYVLYYSSWRVEAGDAPRIAKNIAKKFGYKVICTLLPPRVLLTGIGMERKLDVGPSEFLGLIKNAAFVVTDAFHGTIFSMLYHKPFVTVVQKIGDPRIISLQSSLSLKDHVVTDNNQIDLDRLMNTDFILQERKLAKLREDSLDYLKKAIMA